MTDPSQNPVDLARLATGIPGLDTATGGGLPQGETTLLCGTTGTGKSVLGLQFLAAGILQFGQAGVFVTFEQDPAKLRRVAGSFGWDVGAWEAQGDWAFVDACPVSEREVVLGGQPDLEPLIARIAAAVRATGARRVVLDTLTTVHGRLGDPAQVRGELHRVILALEELGVTAIVTAEREDDHGPLTRYGVEPFVADSIIVLRHALVQERRRRTLEVLKLRGGRHTSGEFPLVIDSGAGIRVIVLSVVALTHPSSEQRVSLGNPQLDAMCGGGALQGSVTLISGATGTGKSLLALEFLTAGPAHDRGLLLSFEESAQQIARSARGWSLDLEAQQASGRLRIDSRYPSSAPVESHLLAIIDALDEHRPDRLVVDGLSAVRHVCHDAGFHEFLMGLAALTKERQIVSVLTSAPPLLGAESASDIEASTLLDAIILLRFVEIHGELHRGIAVLKMRGSDHDKTIRAFDIGAGGSRIGAPYRTTTGILGGGALQLLGAESQRITELYRTVDQPSAARGPR